MSRIDADIAVVGAGPAGQAMALALAQAGFDTVLIDAAAEPPFAPEALDLRVFALSPASTRLLGALGAWPLPLMDRVCAYRHMHVWERDPEHGVHFDAAMLGWSQLGHIVEHSVLQHALAQRIATTASVRCRWGARVEALNIDADSVGINLGGETLCARLLIGADGAASPVRNLTGIRAERVDYRQRGLVANVRTAVQRDGTARQRFLATGPLAFLPLANGACSIVWSLPEREADRLKALPDDEFEREITTAMGGALGRVTLESERAAFPLMRQLAERYVHRRVALVGDAAHVVHPLAGQGLNLGFVDVAALTDVLAAARVRDLDLGSDAVLARYARWRQGDNALAAHTFEAIGRLYALKTPGLFALRDFGQRMVDRLPPLKRRFILHASGLSGRVPSLCRSVA